MWGLRVLEQSLPGSEIPHLSLDKLLLFLLCFWLASASVDLNPKWVPSPQPDSSAIQARAEKRWWGASPQENTELWLDVLFGIWFAKRLHPCRWSAPKPAGREYKLSPSSERTILLAQRMIQKNKQNHHHPYRALLLKSSFSQNPPQLGAWRSLTWSTPRSQPLSAPVVDVASPLLLGHPSLQRPAKRQGSHLCDTELPATDDEAEKFQGEGG